MHNKRTNKLPPNAPKLVTLDGTHLKSVVGGNTGDPSDYAAAELDAASLSLTRPKGDGTVI
jgi:hypothetical protein